MTPQMKRRIAISILTLAGWGAVVACIAMNGWSGVLAAAALLCGVGAVAEGEDR